MRVHPRFKYKKLFEIVSYWPAKGELYVCGEDGLNAFNGAQNIVLLEKAKSINNIYGFGICCQDVEELKRMVKLKQEGILKGPSVKMTYCMLGGSRGNVVLHELLKGWEYVQLYKSNGKKRAYCTYILNLDVKLVHREQMLDVACFLKNKIAGKGLDSLIKGVLESKLPQHFTQTMPFKGEYPSEGGVWMVKKTDVWSLGGHGVYVLSNKDDLPDILKKLNGEPAILQKYIMEPLLFKGKKMQLRVWVMLTTWGEYHVRPRWCLYTAKLPYVKGDWSNPDIHDTHLRSTDGDYSQEDIKDDLPQDAQEQLDLIVKDVVGVCIIKVHEGTEHAYHILGLDIMISQGKLLLLEVNRGPGRAYKEYNISLFEQDWLWEWSCVKHLFNP